MIKKALLVYPKPNELKNFRFGYSLGLLRIGHLFLKYNIKTEYIDFGLTYLSEEEFLDVAYAADIIVLDFDSFSLRRSVNYAHGEFLIELIRKKINSNKIIVVCGNDIILIPRKVKGANETLKTNCFFALDGIKSILEKNFDSSLDLDIEKITPCRELLKLEYEYGQNIIHPSTLAKSAIIRTSFGCHGSCSFCQRRGYFKRFVPLNYDLIRKDFQYLLSNGYKNLWIEDDNFTSDIKRARNILRILKELEANKTLKISLSSWTNITEKDLLLMKEAGVSIISFGIESVDIEIQKFYNKIININKVKKLIQFCDEIGIFTIGNFIIGAPMESKSTINRIREFIMSTPFDEVNIKILDYMVGSSLFQCLPNKLKRVALPSRHIFADKKLGLTSFYYGELKEIACSIKQDFKMVRRAKLLDKIKKYGYPYYNR